jgi:hypothetical protein
MSTYEEEIGVDLDVISVVSKIVFSRASEAAL